MLEYGESVGIGAGFENLKRASFADYSFLLGSRAPPLVRLVLRNPSLSGDELLALSSVQPTLQLQHVVTYENYVRPRR